MYDREDSNIELVADALRKAYRLCETDSQRRGVERAAATIGVAFAERFRGFGRAPFLAYVKDGK